MRLLIFSILLILGIKPSWSFINLLEKLNSGSINDSCVDNKARLENDFIIDPACYQKFRKKKKNVEVEISESLEIGLTCLDKGNAFSKKVSDDLRGIIARDKLSVLCSEQPCKGENDKDCFNWPSDAVAHAQTDISKPPLISFNPEKNLDTGFLSLRGTIFHELLHNLGFKHGDGLEFPYACEVCCFDNPIEELRSKSFENAACNICLNSSGKMDGEYIKNAKIFFDGVGFLNASLDKAVEENYKNNQNDAIAAKFLVQHIKKEWDPTRQRSLFSEKPFRNSILSCAMSRVFKGLIKSYNFDACAEYLTKEEYSYFFENQKNEKIMNAIAMGYFLKITGRTTRLKWYTDLKPFQDPSGLIQFDGRARKYSGLEKHFNLLDNSISNLKRDPDGGMQRILEGIRERSN